MTEADAAPGSADSPSPESRDRATGWLDLDLSRPLAFVALAVVYVASRAPFMNVGYGANPNAWRVALSAYWLRGQHEFYPSRLPGYPIHELASAAVIRGGWLATNSLTLLVSLIGVWFFASIVRKLQAPNPALIVAGFAFTPLLWINSMATMDYMWALTFILGCYYFLLNGQVPFAAIMLGLAVASRPTSLVFAVPFIIYVIRDGRRRELRDFVVWTIAVPMLAYMPIVWRYGPGFLDFYDASVGYLEVLRLVARDSVGLIGAVAVLAGAAISLPRLVRLPVDFVRDKHVTVWLLAIAATLVVFLRLPHESAFLIPMYPFAFLVMARYFRRGVLIAAVAAILVAGFVDVRTRGADLDATALRHPRIGQGLVLANRSTMQAQVAYAHDIAKQQVPDHSVVLLGRMYPYFAVLNRDRLTLDILDKDTSSLSQLSDKGKAVDAQHNIIYVQLPDQAAFAHDVSQRYNMFFTPDAALGAAALYGYRPGLHDGDSGVPVKPLAVPGDPPRGIGAAETPR
jgi:hypothetical protein